MDLSFGDLATGNPSSLLIWIIFLMLIWQQHTHGMGPPFQEAGDLICPSLMAKRRGISASQLPIRRELMRGEREEVAWSSQRHCQSF